MVGDYIVDITYLQYGVSCWSKDPRPEIYQINSTSTTTTTTTSGTTSCSAMNYSHCTSATVIV